MIGTQSTAYKSLLFILPPTNPSPPDPHSSSDFPFSQLPVQVHVTTYFFHRWMWIHYPYVALGNCNDRYTEQSGHITRLISSLYLLPLFLSLLPIHQRTFINHLFETRSTALSGSTHPSFSPSHPSLFSISLFSLPLNSFYPSFHLSLLSTPSPLSPFSILSPLLLPLPQ